MISSIEGLKNNEMSDRVEELRKELREDIMTNVPEYRAEPLIFGQWGTTVTPGKQANLNLLAIHGWHVIGILVPGVVLLERKPFSAR